MLVRKKNARRPAMSYDDAVEEALCVGWIDGIERRYDDDRTLNRFTPRRPRSNWSESNRARVRRLAAAGLMRERGLEALPEDLRTEVAGALPEATPT